MKKQIAALILSAFGLVACSLTTPHDIGNEHRVLLVPPQENLSCGRHIKTGLTILYPKVPDTLNTSRIALLDQNGRWDYYAGMRWADFLPGNIQSALIHSFTDSGGFDTVAGDDSALHRGYALGSEVTLFQMVYRTGAPPEAQIEIAFALREINHQVTKQFIAKATAVAAANSAEGVDHALVTAFKDIERTAIRKTLSCKP